VKHIIKTYLAMYMAQKRTCCLLWSIQQNAHAWAIANFGK